MESELKKRSVRLCLRIFPLRKGIKKNLETTAIGSPIHSVTVFQIAAPQFERYGDSCKRSGGDGIGTEEAKRAPLSPDFPFKKGNQKNLETTAIGSPIHTRSGLFCTQTYLFN